jgi:adenylate cyclase
MPSRNAGVPEAQHIEFRIGINLGDVIVEGEDIYGDGVNVAARLEGLAQPGGICISRVARDQIHDKLPLDLGEQSVKNIARPVGAFNVRLVAPAPAPGEAVPSLPDKPSIAVLPFDNMSGDPEQAYFSDGIAEDIITDLSKVSDLFVIAATLRSPTRENRPTSMTCAANSACGRRLRGACARPAIGCVSTPS